MSNRPIAELRGVSKSYLDGDRRIEVLTDFDLQVTAGASLAVTGPSGSGKSTLLNLLAGLQVSDVGQVWLNLGDDQQPLHELKEDARTALRRRYIGYVFQFFNLVPTLTVLENILLPAELNRAASHEEQAQAMLSAFGLWSRRDDFPDRLSGGEQQRVAVARALLLQPPLLLADEPTGNLDRDNAQQVADLLFNAAQERSTTLVIATHSESVAARADQHLTLRRGD